MVGIKPGIARAYSWKGCACVGGVGRCRASIACDAGAHAKGLCDAIVKGHTLLHALGERLERLVGDLDKRVRARRDRDECIHHQKPLAAAGRRCVVAVANCRRSREAKKARARKVPVVRRKDGWQRAGAREVGTDHLLGDAVVDLAHDGHEIVEVVVTQREAHPLQKGGEAAPRLFLGASLECREYGATNEQHDGKPAERARHGELFCHLFYLCSREFHCVAFS